MKPARVAFSLLEVLLAVATLTVALLLVVALGISVLGRSDKAKDVPIGTIAAENILNQLIYDVNSCPSAARAQWFTYADNPSLKVGTYTMNKIEFAYNIDYERLPVGTSTGLATNHLVKLSIRLTWAKGRGPNSGQQTANLVRLVHEDS